MAKNDSGGADGRIESGRLRDRIDAGALGDKIDFPDPATAPLGTDAEAGGAPVIEEDALGPARRRERLTDAMNDRAAPRRWPYAVGLGTLVLLIVVVLIAFGLPSQ